MFKRRHWIPPGGLLFAQVAHGFSWLLLLWIALTQSVAGIGAPEIAWIHVVALGWFTTAILSILLHVVPAFTDVRWRFESAARGALAVFAGGTVLFVACWFLARQWIATAGLIIAIAIAFFVVIAWITLSQARDAEKTERAIARALAIALSVLLAVAILGTMLAFAVSGFASPTWLLHVPAAHANLAFYGWLSLMIYGISARTVRPITGNKSRFPWTHITVGAGTLIGAPLLAIGLGIANGTIVAVGAVLVAIAAAEYIVDIIDILARADVPHRPPQAFIAASIAWLAVALCFGAVTLGGASLEMAYGFVLLVGWVGQMINAHVMHIGVRLLATIYLGDEDETRPSELLDPRRSWICFALMQLAIALCVAGFARFDHALIAAGAAIGFVAWVVLVSNLAYARRVAKTPRKEIVL